MRTLIVLCCIAFAAAKPSLFQTVAYSAPASVIASPVSITSQYHAQDALGQYTYGYSDGTSVKTESKSLDGVTRGGYSYLDPNGVVQTANYVADDIHGFQVAATNLPKYVAPYVHDTPEVAAAKVAHVAAYNKAAYEAAITPDVGDSVVVAPAVSTYVAPVNVVKEVPSKVFSYSTVEASPVVSHLALSPAVTSYAVAPVSVVKKVEPSKAFSYSTVGASPSLAISPAAISYKVAAEKVPVLSYSKVDHKLPVLSYSSVEHHAPIAMSYSAPAVGVLSANHQYHAQDALGQYSYGYSGGPSAKVESKTLDGVTRGGYSYIDGNGIVQSANYVADDVNGFRVAATNLPVGISGQVVHKVAVSPVVAHQVIADTPEVVAAKAAHFAAHAAVKSHDYYDY